MPAISTPCEIWKSVVGQEAQFEVSNLGGVRSLDRTTWRRPSRRHPDPQGWLQRWPGKVLKPCPTSTGHLQVKIRQESRLVHRLVLEAFVGPCPDGMEGLHRDDIPAHNWLENLRWGTRSDNLNDAVRNGRHPLGEGHHWTTITEAQALAVKRLPNLSGREVACRTGVKRQTVYDIRAGKSWRWLKEA